MEEKWPMDEENATISYCISKQSVEFGASSLKKRSWVTGRLYGFECNDSFWFTSWLEKTAKAVVFQVLMKIHKRPRRILARVSAIYSKRWQGFMSGCTFLNGFSVLYIIFFLKCSWTILTTVKAFWYCFDNSSELSLFWSDCMSNSNVTIWRPWLHRWNFNIMVALLILSLEILWKLIHTLTPCPLK